MMVKLQQQCKVDICFCCCEVDGENVYYLIVGLVLVVFGDYEGQCGGVNYDFQIN